MLDHVTITVSDLAASRRFYETVLDVLGISVSDGGQDMVGWDDFLIVAATEQRLATRHLHAGFVSPSRELVDRFWQTGIDAGYQDDGRPGPRPQYSPEYYGGFLVDPDGNSVEAVHHEDTRRGGHIDHLWIGVADLDESERFYRLIARHTGLRGGRRTDDRRQFRGAWATFALVCDGRPPTENLCLAFPAPDQETVEAFHRSATGAGYRDCGASVLDPDGTRVESVLR